MFLHNFIHSSLQSLNLFCSKGIQEDVEKFSRRLVKVTKQHNEEAKKLLSLMGMPYIEAPCEAEAQCAALAKSGKVRMVAQIIFTIW